MSRAVAALALTALLAAGCGGGGGSTTTAVSGPPGRQVFVKANCGSCHTLAAAGGQGTLGPSFDAVRISPAAAEQIIRSGGTGMPSYAGQLSDAEIRQVAKYVASGGR